MALKHLDLWLYPGSVPNGAKTLAVRFYCRALVKADRKALIQWLSNLPGPWMGALEATIFTGCIFDFLKVLQVCVTKLFSIFQQSTL